MGQPSLPLLNKSGYTMHWSTSWANIISYKKFLYFDIFFKKFFFLFFSDKLIFFYIKQFYIFDKTLSLEDLAKKKEEKSLPKYVTSVWFLHFQGWVILSLFIYVPSVFTKTNKILAIFQDITRVSLFTFFNRKQKKLNQYKYRL